MDLIDEILVERSIQIRNEVAEGYTRSSREDYKVNRKVSKVNFVRNLFS